MDKSCCGQVQSQPCAKGRGPGDPFAWFGRMIANCLEYAQAAKREGRPVVGILCEYTPRELILAAGGVPVCLCAGSAATIPAAEEYLPSNLCPLIKSTFGYHVKRSNPFLEMADLLVAETTCDGKKKMYELLAESRPMIVLELPQKADDEESLKAWERELRRLQAALEERFGVRITDCRLREAIAAMNRERALRRRLAEFMRLEPPPLTGRQLLELKSSISGIPADLEQYEQAIARLEERIGQDQKPVARRPDAGATPGGQDGCPSRLGGQDARPPLPAGGDSCAPVRVLMTGVPVVHGAERVVDIIESAGGVVVCMENCTGLKPILEDVDAAAADPLRTLAEKYYHLPCSVMTRNDRRMDLLRALARAYRPECVIELVWQACLTYDIESHAVKRLAEGELGLPYLKIVTDYSPSDSARIAMRVEALYETTRARRNSR
ncbi:MAG TPA: 2-hydroxyacyl-CoA dehydratase family protein [Phycisphaerae bacterium]|nr:2-hydroxyacyl-CoA dehydratase [Phycisphaerae bacterium]HOB76806.1 2-hydroxyacyl-CoA dehydratase family protein [Phycisphaerae bacterium]HOJ53522.1 2-hydroxyacyl-CoA dehydratase family protein [Phycisphaerae bacterium]HOL25321.1 2-hydroxyacyl-CoA dehydratase family protein [Phycisphaerae bacterium]HPU32182.1 2-hydroxyacyl-CoA dehydratase family protein [Phycisphaerae bacterium]